MHPPGSRHERCAEGEYMVDHLGDSRSAAAPWAAPARMNCTVATAPILWTPPTACEATTQYTVGRDGMPARETPEGLCNGLPVRRTEARRAPEAKGRGRGFRRALQEDASGEKKRSFREETGVDSPGLHRLSEDCRAVPGIPVFHACGRWTSGLWDTRMGQIISRWVSVD